MTDDYLIKPFSARELLALVETHVKMARMRRDAQIALRESEERLRLVNLATNDVICDWEIDTDTIMEPGDRDAVRVELCSFPAPHGGLVERAHPSR